MSHDSDDQGQRPVLGQVCPNCGSVATPADRCVYCQASNPWLFETPLRAALQFQAVQDVVQQGFDLTVELQMENLRTGQKLTQRGRESASGQAAGIEYSIRWCGGDATVELRCGDQASRHESPFEVTAGDWRIAGRLFVVPDQEQDSAQASATPLLRAFPVRSATALIGRSSACELQVPDNAVELTHACVVLRPRSVDAASNDANEVWIGPVHRQAAVFVNGQRILAKPLDGGDLVQIGPFAWVYSEANSSLVPVAPVAGVKLEAQQLCLQDRLGPLDLAVPSGQFTVIVGRSGSGKSTLLRALAAEPESRDRGTIQIAGRDVSHEPDWYRSVIGYVPQDSIVHPELSPRSAVRFTARLRGAPATSSIVECILHLLELREDRWDARIRQLSGGERRRVRTASELVTEPRIFLLDEPGSGLDYHREQRLMRLLGSLSRQGATVIAIVHNLEFLHFADRVLSVAEGQIVFDGTPTEFSRHPDPFQPTADTSAAPVAPVVKVDSEQSGGTEQMADPIGEPALASAESTVWLPPAQRQLQVLLRREWELTRCDAMRRLVLPLLVVPLVFAFSLGIAIPSSATGLLGFFTVLAAIWMGASLGTLAICKERAIFDHEKHLFLRIPLYLVAKTTLLGTIAAFQVVALLLFLTVVRSLAGAEMLHDVVFSAGALVLTSIAALMLGLCLSASANRSTEVANFVLPLLMVIQIIFSVPISVGSNRDLQEAYGEFHATGCSVPICDRRATRWVTSPQHAWLCKTCRQHLRGIDTSAPPQQRWQRLLDLRQADFQADRRDYLQQQEREADAQLPNRLAGLASGITLSRYGDILIQSKATRSDVPADVWQDYGYGYWIWYAARRLVFAALVFGSAAGIVLWFQTSDRYIRDSASRRARDLTQRAWQRCRGLARFNKASGA